MTDPITERVPLVNLDQVREQATRCADGMTFNRELLAKNVHAMERELRMWREKYAPDVAMAN